MLLRHRLLRPACLPIPPPGQSLETQKTYGPASWSKHRIRLLSVTKQARCLASRRRPSSPCTIYRCSSARSARAIFISNKIFCARSWSCRPASVSFTLRPRRSNSRHSSSCSSDLMAWLTADCVMKSSRAANVKLPTRASVVNARSFRLSMIGVMLLGRALMPLPSKTCASYAR